VKENFFAGFCGASNLHFPAKDIEKAIPFLWVDVV